MVLGLRLALATCWRCGGAVGWYASWLPGCGIGGSHLTGFSQASSLAPLGLGSFRLTVRLCRGGPGAMVLLAYALCGADAGAMLFGVWLAGLLLMPNPLGQCFRLCLIGRLSGRACWLQPWGCVLWLGGCIVQVPRLFWVGRSACRMARSHGPVNVRLVMSTPRGEVLSSSRPSTEGVRPPGKLRPFCSHLVST